jgi:hypothetical protein
VGAEGDVVAAEQEPVGPGALRVGEHRVERGEVAVDVEEQREHPGPLPADLGLEHPRRRA